MEKIKLDVNMNQNPTDLTWKPSGNAVVIKMTNSDVDLTLDLGPEVLKQLRQALYWVPEKEIA